MGQLALELPGSVVRGAHPAAEGAQELERRELAGARVQQLSVRDRLSDDRVARRDPHAARL